MTQFDQRMKVVFWTIIELSGAIFVAQGLFSLFSGFMNAKDDLLVILGIVGLIVDILCYVWLSLHILHKQYHKFISIPQDNVKDQDISPTP